MKKRTYRAVPIQRVSAEQLAEIVGEDKAIVGVDLAKKKIYASFADAAGCVGRIVRFEHPAQTMEFVQRVEELQRERPVEVVTESTGTYGESIRYQLSKIGVPLFNVATKRVHDAAEVFDGVPSLHDAKACVVMTQLHVQGATRPLERADDQKRSMRALVNRREIYAVPHQQGLGRIEAILARHWPEGLQSLDVWQWKSALVLLAELPGPTMIAEHSVEAAALLKKAGRGKISPERIGEILESARSIGEPMNEEERGTLRELATEALRLRSALSRVDAEIEAVAKASESAKAIAPTVGRVTAVVLIAYLGDLERYGSAGALEKACGLNLKVRSSGEREGKLSITKRGPSIVRRYLYFAVLRLLQNDPLLGAWYRARGGYRGGHKIVAVVALMRKLIRALWHVARGAPFDSTKLVDARKLGFEPTQPLTDPADLRAGA